MRHTQRLPPLSLRLLATLTALLLGVAFLTGCGGGGTETAAASGEVVIGLTDAEGEFLFYEVDVLSIRLTKANGASVEALPMQTRIDFAELTEMTEFVTAQSIPAGRYTSATLTLDYGAAEVQVEDVGGAGVAPVLLDEDGNPVSVLEMEVRLDINRPLVVAPGIPAHLTLDFDLAATHSVGWNGSEATVTVAPVLLADVELAEPKPHRVRGPLVSVNEGDQTFVLGIRPLRAHRHLGAHHLGRLLVVTGAETNFEVDGVSETGSDGLALLAAKDPGIPVVVIGDLVPGTRRQFRALEVYVGSSVPGGNLDGVVGTVLARSGDVLTVRGSTLARNSGSRRCGTLAIAITDATTFSKQGDSDAVLDAYSVSVGQKVAALGDLSVATEPAAIPAQHIRLLTTHLSGEVVEARPPEPESGDLDVDLQSIDRLPLGWAGFDFAGTGRSAADDADPTAYTLDTGTLSLSNLAAGEPVRAFGFVAPFGSASPDFEAISIVALAELRGHLRVNWPEGSTTAIAVAQDYASLTLDLSEAGVRRHVVRGGVATELDDEPPPLIVPDAARGLYLLRHARRCAMYLSFERFSAALEAALADGTVVRTVGADGWFDDATQTLTARRVHVSLH